MEPYQLHAFEGYGIANPTPKVSSSETCNVPDSDQMLLDFFGVTPKEEAKRPHRKKKRKKDRDRVKEDAFIVNDLQDEDATISYYELCDNLYGADEILAHP